MSTGDGTILMHPNMALRKKTRREYSAEAVSFVWGGKSPL